MGGQTPSGTPAAAARPGTRLEQQPASPPPGCWRRPGRHRPALPLHQRQATPWLTCAHHLCTGSIWAREPASRGPHRPDQAGKRGILGLGLRGSPAPDRHPVRRTPRAQPPRRRPVPAAVHRRTGPPVCRSNPPDRCRGRRLVDPELADVLSAIISRIRDSTSAVPLVPGWGTSQETWNPPMPLLFQRADVRRTPSHQRRVPAGDLPKGTGHRRDPRPRRPAADLHPARLPQDLRHRCRDRRPAAAHRTDHLRPSRHQHHHALQGRLPRRSHRGAPRLHSRPSAAPPGPAKNTVLRPTRNGMHSSPTSRNGKYPWAHAPAPSERRALVSTLVSGARSCGQDPAQRSPGLRRSTRTSATASPKPNAKAGPAKPRD